VPAIMRGSRVPADRADQVPAKAGCCSTVQVDPTLGSRRGKARQTSEKYEQEDGERMTIF